MTFVRSLYRYSYTLRLSTSRRRSLTSFAGVLKRTGENQVCVCLPRKQCMNMWHYFHTSTSIQNQPGQESNQKQSNHFQSKGNQQQQQQLQQLLQQKQEEGSVVSTTSSYGTTENSSWFIRTLIPQHFIPYAQLARIDKPIGTMLLLYPCLWSTALATHPILFIQTTTPTTMDLFSIVAGDPYIITLFIAGAFIMRSAGCTINDMWDVQYDRFVVRTRTRPLASGKLSIHQATSFLSLQLFAGLGILCSFPTDNLYFCFLVGLSSMPLVILYPLMKRFTNVPQLILGLTFNWGTFMGWAAVHGSFFSTTTSMISTHQDLLVSNISVLNHGLSVIIPLYIGSVAWTLVYDTLYAHQDKADDEKLGLKSTALYFGKDETKQRLILSSLSLITGGGWMMAGYQLGLDIERLTLHPLCSLYYIGCLSAMSHLLWQVNTAKFDDLNNLSHRFKSNNVVGAIMLGSCIMGNVGLFL